MATVQSMTLDRLLDLEADTVIGGHIDVAGDLILEQHDGGEINAGSVLATVPDASETVKGKVELATTAEATAGADTERAVTPAGLAAAVGTLVPDSSTTVKGKVELATDAETITGTDATRAVTPAALRAVFNAMYPVGHIYLATVSTNPNTILGFGTWASFGAGRMLISQNGSFPAGNTGGASTVNIAEANLPAHTHSDGTLVTSSDGTHTHSIGRDQDGATGSVERVLHSSGISGAEQVFSGQLTSDGAHTHDVTGATGSTGSGTALNVMNPWISVYMWQRTA